MAGTRFLDSRPTPLLVLMTSLLLDFSFPPTIAIARTWVVTIDGTGDVPTVQMGIDYADVGDTVLVGPGTYYEAIDYKGKDLVLLGRDGPSTTILDGSNFEVPIVSLVNNESLAAVLEGFTIRLARAGGVDAHNASPVIRNNYVVNNLAATRLGTGSDFSWGGGIEVSGNAIIEDNIFEANESSVNGGCLSVDANSPIIRNNIFLNNRSAYDGGAILISSVGGHCLIEGNVFQSNVAGDHGGALEIWRVWGSLTIRNNLFVDNVAKGNDGAQNSSTGGAVSIRTAEKVYVENNTFVDSRGISWASCTGGAILFSSAANCRVVRNIFAGSEGCAVHCEFSGNPGEFRDNLFWGSTPDDLSNTCPAGLGEANIYADPMFCDPASGNYRVDRQSPALSGGLVIGAYPTPGCDGGVTAIPVTWGRLKAMYGSR